MIIIQITQISLKINHCVAGLEPYAIKDKDNPTSERMMVFSVADLLINKI